MNTSRTRIGAAKIRGAAKTRGAAQSGGSPESRAAGRRRKSSAPTVPPENLSYGYYARLFRQAEMQDLPTSLEGGVQDEAAMLKVLIRRVFELAAGSEEPAELIHTLQALGQAAARLASLLETQKSLSLQEDRVMRELNLALDDVLADLGRK